GLREKFFFQPFLLPSLFRGEIRRRANGIAAGVIVELNDPKSEGSGARSRFAALAGRDDQPPHSKKS
ncbi:MAG: hypothetical protein VCF07_09800, partial [Nitrospinota bacterium]